MVCIIMLEERFVIVPAEQVVPGALQVAFGICQLLVHAKSLFSASRAWPLIENVQRDCSSTLAMDSVTLNGMSDVDSRMGLLN